MIDRVEATFVAGVLREPSLLSEEAISLTIDRLRSDPRLSEVASVARDPDAVVALRDRSWLLDRELRIAGGTLPADMSANRHAVLTCAGLILQRRLRELAERCEASARVQS